MRLRLKIAAGLASLALAGPAAASVCTDQDMSIDLERRAADCQADLDAVIDRSTAPYLVFNLGYTLRLLGRSEEALPLLNEALRYNPRDPQYWAELGRLYRDFGEPGTAAAMLTQSLALRPDPFAQADRAEAWLDLGRVDLCLADVEASLPELEKQDSDAYYQVLHGRCLVESGDPERALTAFDQAIAKTANDEFAWGHKLSTLAVLKRHQDVLDVSDKMLAPAFDPPLSQGWEQTTRSLRIEALRGLGRPEAEMQAEVDVLTKKYPDDLETINTNARFLIASGRPEDADAAVKTIRSGDLPAYVIDTIAQIDLALGRSEQALAGFEQAIRLDPSVTKDWLPPLAAQGYLPQTKKGDDVLRSLSRCITEKGKDCRLMP